MEEVNKTYYDMSYFGKQNFLISMEFMEIGENCPGTSSYFKNECHNDGIASLDFVNFIRFKNGSIF